MRNLCVFIPEVQPPGLVVFWLLFELRSIPYGCSHATFLSQIPFLIKKVKIIKEVEKFKKIEVSRVKKTKKFKNSNKPVFAHRYNKAV